MLKGWFAENLMEIKDHYKDRRKNTGLSRAKGLRVLRKSKKSHGTRMFSLDVTMFRLLRILTRNF